MNGPITDPQPTSHPKVRLKLLRQENVAYLNYHMPASVVAWFETVLKEHHCLFVMYVMYCSQLIHICWESLQLLYKVDLDVEAILVFIAYPHVSLSYHCAYIMYQVCTKYSDDCPQILWECWISSKKITLGNIVATLVCDHYWYCCRPCFCNYNISLMWLCGLGSIIFSPILLCLTGIEVYDNY